MQRIRLRPFFLKLIWNRVLQHLLFWIVSFVILVNFFSTSNEIQKIDYIYTGIFHVSLLTGVYFNLYILIPGLLRKERYIYYLLSLGVLTVLSAEFNIITFDHIIDLVLPGYYFISYYEFADILKFLVVYLGLTSLLKLAKGWFSLIEANQKMLKIEQEKTQAELKALKSQINPHFLFNSLNSIYSLAMKNSKHTPGVILLLSELMRYMLYESNTNLVPLKKEIRYLENYVELQKLRTDEKSDIRIKVKGKVEDQKIAPLLFLPFIENSFKHGIKGETTGGFVHICLTIFDNELSMEIENNKGKVDEVEKDKLKGIGLKNAKRRLELLYPGKHELRLQDQAKTFKIELQLDLS